MIFRKRKRDNRKEVTDVVRAILADKYGEIDLDTWLPKSHTLTGWTISRTMTGISINLEFGVDFGRISPSTTKFLDEENNDG